jgi:hypothetical protein
VEVQARNTQVAEIEQCIVAIASVPRSRGMPQGSQISQIRLHVVSLRQQIEHWPNLKIERGGVSQGLCIWDWRLGMTASNELQSNISTKGINQIVDVLHDLYPSVQNLVAFPKAAFASFVVIEDHLLLNETLLLFVLYDMVSKC